jgi:molybdopterin-containing oxidoreductase family iron-sulfur binding subunit
VLPPGTALEDWGDAEAWSGVYTLQQPAMRSREDIRGMGEVLLAIAKGAGLVAPAAEPPEGDAAPAVTEPSEDGEAPPAVALPDLSAASYRDYQAAWWKAVVWEAAGRPGAFETFWTDALQRGGVFLAVSKPAAFGLAKAPDTAAATPAGDGLVLTAFPHPFILDGRHANKPWAQEVPEPLTSYTWGTWAEIHPDTAAKLGLDERKGITLATDAGSIDIGWFASPTIAADTVAVVLGNGHRDSGRYAKFGANPMGLFKSNVDAASGGLSLGARAKVSQSGEQNLFAYIGSKTLEDRGVNFAVSVDDMGKAGAPASIVPAHHVPVDKRLTDAGMNDMYPEPDHPTYRFAMAVDNNRCTGCGACETACFAENNIPFVGPEQIRYARHMGWIRLSRYFEGDAEEPDVRFQMNVCQQCSHAPCEGVCPVLATYHNLDGLNAMVYNRCVGTRYCANNCPYTARRFNFHTYRWPESYNLMLNPDIVTREMGVMEKCTFCVHRLRDIKDQYRDDGETVPDSALLKLTACAQACPSDAITFGNAKDPAGAVSKLWQEPRAYAMLGELNTKPGVRYLARISHSPSKLHGHGGGHGGGHGDTHEGGGHEAAGDHGSDGAHH